jgi:hypothetical protein
MNHAQYKEQLCLTLFDELSGEEQRLLDAHLGACEECRNELEDIRRVQAEMDRASVEVTDALLSEARAALHTALVRLRRKRSAADAVRAFIAESLVPRYRIAFGGIAMAVAGLFIGYLVFAPAGKNSLPGSSVAGRSVSGGALQQRVEKEESRAADAEGTLASDDAHSPGARSSFTKGGARATNVRIIHADARTGAVEFVFDAVSPVHVSGNVNDENVRKILVRTLSDEENPGVRLKAVGMILSNAETETNLDPEMKTALITALKKDDNPAVRQAALAVLQLHSQDKEIQRALAYVLLHDKNSGVRIAAINTLALARVDGHAVDPSVMTVLKRKIQFDKNIFIQNQSRNILQEGSQS